MVKHVVMWKFKNGTVDATKEENLRKAKALLDSLPGMIAEIKSFEVGIDELHSETSYDLVLNSTFESKDAMVAYQQHPEHVRVVGFLRTVHMGKVVVDYEL